jgi:hypothetical protein
MYGHALTPIAACVLAVQASIAANTYVVSGTPTTKSLAGVLAGQKQHSVTQQQTLITAQYMEAAGQRPASLRRTGFRA